MKNLDSLLTKVVKVRGKKLYLGLKEIFQFQITQYFQMKGKCQRFIVFTIIREQPLKRLRFGIGHKNNLKDIIINLGGYFLFLAGLA